MADFVPGLELGEQFFTEAGKPIIDTYFRGLRYRASSCSYHRMIMKSISHARQPHLRGSFVLRTLIPIQFTNRISASN